MWIGGYLGPSYKLMLKDDELVYESYERGYVLKDTLRFSVEDLDWDRFYQEIAQFAPWEWDATYRGHDAPDGTTWYVVMEDASHRVESRGLNRYPPGYVGFLRTVRALLGGLPFA